ncbi:MAG: hypothetical protein ACK5AV_02580, partial [Alphaproteobacteria bacterium]
MNKPLILFMTPTLVLCILSAHLSIAINTTDSLKHKVFLVVKDVLPDSYEDYVMFKAPANGL